MTDKNANTEIRKEFCPNCEADVPCTHEAELFVCDICGEDFAKYIVSRNCNVSDVSTTQDVLITIKKPFNIEDYRPYADRHRNKYVRSGPHWPLVLRYPVLFDEYEKTLTRAESAEAKVERRSRELQYANTLCLDLKHRAESAEAKVKELEAAQRWIPVSERLPEEWQNVLVIGRDGCIFNWLYTSRMVQPFILHWTHWMPFKPPKPEEVEE